MSVQAIPRAAFEVAGQTGDGIFDLVCAEEAPGGLRGADLRVEERLGPAVERLGEAVEAVDRDRHLVDGCAAEQVADSLDLRVAAPLRRDQRRCVPGEP